MAAFIVLLRAIGPITHRIMSMAQWREAVEADGFAQAQTYVATGNMLMDGEGTLPAVTQRMDAVVRGLGLGAHNKAVVRRPMQLKRLLKTNPFPDAAIERPSEVAVYFFAKAKPDFGWIADYDGPERLHVQDDHLIVDYLGRASQSPRLPGLIEKRSGVVTARNWNTVRGLVERAAARQKQ